MPGIVYGCITPHPPIMVPQIGRGREAEVSASIDAMGRVAQELSEGEVDSVLIVSPHGTTYPDTMGVLTAPCSQGTMSNWGAEGVDYRFDNDTKLVDAVKEEAKEAEIPLASIGGDSYDLDHGVMVPAFFLIEALRTRPLVPLSFSMLSLETHLEFGRVVRRAAERCGKRVAFIASGDLSHRLLPEAPAGYDPMGQVFDRELARAVESLDSQAILSMDPDLVWRAGECGLRSITILLGALEGLQARPEVLSYEGPFGVGYLTASFAVMENASIPPHPLVRLAKEAVEQFVRTNTIKAPPSELSEEMLKRAGVFVSTKCKGRLRGCVGSIEPVRPNVAAEVIASAIGAANRDSRFPPIRPDELSDLEYSVDVLTPLEAVAGLDQLDPKIYGVVVRRGDKTGVLLPDLEQVKTPAQQVEICRAKAGIGPEEPADLFRFRAERFQ